ncbi:MAG: TetR family transcriptional regulator C-terminal domain-containing protein [Boseongicola sp.]
METLEKPISKTSKRKPTKRDPEASRQALIDATLDTIAEIGFTDTTVSSIIQRAGLSRGMIHLHFGGKDNLLTSAAKHFSDEYYAEMDRQIALAKASPQDIIMTVVSADLSEALLNERSTNIWHAFRGVASSNPGIAKFSSTQDERLQTTILRAFEQIAEEEGLDNASDVARDATFGTLALLEGMWVHFLSDKRGFSRDNAISLIRRFLTGLFPGHFALTANIQIS